MKKLKPGIITAKVADEDEDHPIGVLAIGAGCDD
ncbi:MAG: hypothetical protein LiPW30_581 [Parcubacteria group bacterium LiPW_30]|mgnify:FL=1|nr:MAG: hypothetical protein LiPW30_581 [Parcubacteria group bacterium LiPW_30]